MFEKVNITRKLHETAIKNAQKQLLSDQSALDMINSQLKQEDSETSDVLKYFGTGQKRTEIASKVDANKVLLDNQLVSGEDIRKICLNYDLRFLPAKNFIGAIPLKSLNDIRVFEKECKEKNPERYANTLGDKSGVFYHPNRFVIDPFGIPRHVISDSTGPVMINEAVFTRGLDSYIGAESFGDRLFVIAPKKHFVSLVDPKADPVILYNAGGNNYKVITQFGNDFSFMRRIRGWIKSRHFFIWNAVFLAIIISVLIAQFGFKINSVIFPIISSVNLVALLIFNNLHKGNYKDDWNSSSDLKFQP